MAHPEEDLATRDIVIDAVVDAAAKLGVQITSSKVRGWTRSSKVVDARYVTMFILREHYGHSLVAIGRMFRKDHSVVFYGTRVIQERIERHSYCGNLYVDAVGSLGIPEVGWLDPFTGKDPLRYVRRKNGSLRDPDKPELCEGGSSVLPMNWKPGELKEMKARAKYPGSMPWQDYVRRDK